MPKPLIFGDATLDADRLESLEDLHQNWDNSYIPGYSEFRQENDRRMSRGLKPLEGPRAQWVPIGNSTGGDIDYRNIFPYVKLGYRFVEVDDLEKLGWGFPPTAYVAEDGTIRREDTALAFVSAERAAHNIKIQRRENEAFHGRPSNEGPVEDLEDEGLSGHGDLKQALHALNQLKP